MSAACPPVALRADKQRVAFALSYSYRWIAKTATPGGHGDGQFEKREVPVTTRVLFAFFIARARSTPSAAPCSQQLPTHSRQHHSSWRHSHLLLATAKSGRGTTTSNYRRQRRPPPSLPLPLLRLLPPALPPLRHQHALPYSRPRRSPRSRRCVSRCVTRASRRRRELPNAPAVLKPCFCTPSRRRSSPRARS